MTNKEAIKWLKKLYIRTDITDEYGDMEDMQPYEEAVNIAIKALDQESILDKIRAEIEQNAKDYDKIDDYRDGRGFWLSLGIIDKYKAQISEVEK